ncbi:MAG: DNA polymerase III subunit delta [Candidatus Saccharibacteria bacterium]|nr:DNA polymerase III subunit delta [Candidatus Saccharibacteria bacterium]
MIHVLTGPNDFLRMQRKRELIESFVKEHGDLALERFEGEETEPAKIRESLESLPFLAAKKLVVLREPGANKDFAESAESLLENVPETTDLIIEEPKFDKRSRYFTYCKKLGGFKEFDHLPEPALKKWAPDYVKKWQARIEPQAAGELIRRAGTDQLKLANELDKLCMFTADIDVEAVNQLVMATPSSTIFELIDAAFSGDVQRAVRLYDEQRALQVEPLHIVAMFAWQFHVLAIVKAADDMPPGEIAKRAKLNPYVVQKTGRIARKLSLGEIKTYVRALRRLDEKLKSTRMNADDALKSFIISLPAR